MDRVKKQSECALLDRHRQTLSNPQDFPLLYTALYYSTLLCATHTHTPHYTGTSQLGSLTVLPWVALFLLGRFVWGVGWYQPLTSWGNRIGLGTPSFTIIVFYSVISDLSLVVHVPLHCETSWGSWKICWGSAESWVRSGLRALRRRRPWAVSWPRIMSM